MSDAQILWGCADPTEDDVWAEYFSKLDHQDKAKAFLADILQCGTKFEKQRQQKEDFLDWYPWRFDRCMCEEESEERDRAWCKMGDDNPYYHEWDEAMARPGGAYKPPEIHPFCDECGLFHADNVKWCHYYKIGDWCKECAIPHDWRLPWPHP